MNSEIIYLNGSGLVSGLGNRKKSLNKSILIELDRLASLMKKPDKNFEELKNIWDKNKKLRLLKGALL